MTNPTPHGQVPEALIDLIDEYAETRHRCGGVYNAKTEAARKAVIEALSGVQALSAAPAIGDELRDTLVAVSAAIAERDDRAAQKMIREILAASPTPPAEQQAAPEAAQGGADPADIIAGVLQISRGHAIEMMREALEAAPQQEAQEPAFWMNEKGHTWSHSDWKQFPKHRAKYPIPLYPHFPAPQPAPACHHRPPCAECASLTAQGGKV